MAPRPHVESNQLALLWDMLKDPSCAVMRETWPRPAPLAFLDALTESAPERAKALELAHKFLEGLLCVPVIAVAGLINAGKSSLVASFLSAAGRERVLRGVQRSAGTHRFTLWCPAAWQVDASFRQPLESLLVGVFGEPSQPLELAPHEAHAQQRQRGRLSTPLLAFDPGLDAHGVCLLDCPDIQRREDGSEAEPGLRHLVLEAAGRLCSAIFVVLPRHELEVEQVADVLNALPHALCVLALNFCSGEPPAVIAAEARAAWGSLASSVYVAFDFRHKGYEAFTPAWDPNLTTNSAPYGSFFPCFFEVSDDPRQNEPSTVADHRSLLALGRRLPPDRLLQQRHRELLRDLRSEILAAGEFLAVRAASDAAAVQSAGRALQEELSRLLERDGDLRIKIDPRLIEDFASSIRRTAPLDLKPFLWMSQKAGAAVRTLRNLVRGITGGISEKVQSEGRRIGAALVDARMDADRIADRLRLWSASLRQPRDREYWLPVAERILSRFQAYDGARLPAAEWDERAQDLWRAVPVWRARLAVLTTVLVALAAVALLSVAGGPVLMALGLKSAALTVTVKELLVVVGLGSVAQGEAARRLDEWLRTRVGQQQRSSLVAIAFDEVGLPRASLENIEPSPALAEKPRLDGFAIREIKARLRVWRPEAWARIRQQLDNLES